MAIGANLTKREQTLVAVAAFAVLLLGAYWYFFYAPKSSELEVLRARIVECRTTAGRRGARRSYARDHADPGARAE
jgi:type II secretory pathway component PulM